MKIKRIQINNLGPYIDENVFDFEVSNSVKNMVLIGGRNGAGKTTLFNSIKICLYGCHAYGYESNNAKYMIEVDSLINSSERINKNGRASVSIDLLLDDGMNDYTYTFERYWIFSGKKITENFNLYKNGICVSEIEKGDFENYLLQLLPPNLFKFYFFDGEKIGEFIFNGVRNTDFKDAFLKLCGLDTMDIIRDNFRRISRGTTESNHGAEEKYYYLIDEREKITCKIDEAKNKQEAISNQITFLEDDLILLNKKYAKHGGVDRKEWMSMQEQISKEEAKREQTRKWLKDAANNVLPFIILRNQLEYLKYQIELEDKFQTGMSFKKSIDSEPIRAILANTFELSGINFADDLTQKVIDEIQDYFDHMDDSQIILNLSKRDQFDLIAKINNLINFDSNRIKEATDIIESSLKRAKQIRTKMEKSSIENYDEYLKRKSDINELKSKLSNEIFECEKEISSLREELKSSETQLKKARENYELILKKKSIKDISSRALLAFDELQEILYKKYIAEVESGFKKYFSALINKSNLLDGIFINESLNVIPYRIKHYKKADIISMLNKFGEEYIIDQLGIYAYEIISQKIDSQDNEFDIPVEVKQQLSAGEKQVFIMALYQALSRINKISVPYIIDTPFARIDKEHRSNILKNFFMQLDGQVIVLSTDEEIVSDYNEIIADIVSNRFLLNHTESGNTQVLANTYFGGKI